MAVGDFAREVLVTAHQVGLPLTSGSTVAWLSGLGHRDPAVKAVPPAVLKRLEQIHAALGGDDGMLLKKRRSQPKVDFWLNGDVLVELDELQHFSSCRLATLPFYEGMTHELDLEAYRSLCQRHHARANKKFPPRPVKDFSFRGGRIAQRAYMDAVRDLLAPVFGLRVFRIPAPDCNVGAAIATLRNFLPP